MGTLKDFAQEDTKIFSSDQNGFADEITFTSPKQDVAVVNGIHSKHHLGISTEGNMVNSKKAHCSASEQLLIDQGYPVRNAAGEVDLEGHLVDVKDSTGTVKNYVTQSWFPNETLGYITIILEDYGEDS